MDTMKSTDIELDVELLSWTQRAIKVYDGAVEVWIPKSLVVEPLLEDLEELKIGAIFTLIIPEWKAKQGGLI